jgi:hypothetical protein
MMRTRLLVVLVSLCASAMAQTFQVTIAVDPSADTARISPFIYGTNGQSNDRGLNITARRLGGNRMTGYNWENNASNMGTDYDGSNANDNYMTWVMGIPSGKENTPGITLSTFHDTSLAMSCYSLITLPAAGYVARDKNGSVTTPQVAPSARFREVRMQKGAGLAMQPDTSDGIVSVDEEVNFVVQKYGGAASGRGIRGYDIDNEPALWPSTHPRIHPAKTTCAEIIGKTLACGRAVKNVDPNAEIFGGVFYGFNEYYSLQDAPDYAANFGKQGWFINGFLKALHDSSVAAGMRLVDVLDLHWYPDLDIPVINENIDSLTIFTRMQVPRSLWDSTYVEPGWIGKWFSPVSVIPNVQSAIAKNYPGTRLSFSEFNYGGATHISGGIALADVLGIFGKYGIYLATHWGSVDGYLRAAYALYRNYDGNGGTFGDRHIRATNSNTTKASVYASARSTDPHTLDIVVINKDFTNAMQASIAIGGSTSFNVARNFGFDATHASVAEFSPVPSIAGNSFSISIPPLSVHHLVLSSVATEVAEGVAPSGGFRLEQNYPNPFNPSTTIRYGVADGGTAKSGTEGTEALGAGKAGSGGSGLGSRWVRLSVYDILGREVVVLVNEKKQPGFYEVMFDGSQLSSGMYLYRLQAGESVTSKSMLLLR